MTLICNAHINGREATDSWATQIQDKKVYDANSI